MLIGALLGCTICLRRRFDPEGTLKAIHELRPSVLAVVPVMMQRILELGPDVIRRYDTSSLKLVLKAEIGASISLNASNPARLMAAMFDPAMVLAMIILLCYWLFIEGS